MAKSLSYSEMTLPAKSSKFVTSVEEKTIVGGISELVTGIKVLYRDKECFAFKLQAGCSRKLQASCSRKLQAKQESNNYPNHLLDNNCTQKLRQFITCRLICDKPSTSISCKATKHVTYTESLQQLCLMLPLKWIVGNLYNSKYL